VATSYSHAVVGLAIAPLYRPGRRAWLYWTLCAVLPVIPDFDVFSGYAYGSLWGHRGVTHSLLFALWFAFLIASLTFRVLQANLWILTLIFFAAMGSHGLLDACTRGGGNIPLFWPVNDDWFGNWGPIPVSDMAFELPNPSRSRAFRSELFWVWLPAAIWMAGVLTCRRVSAHKRATAPTP
jgi:inner membrane protein